MPETLPPRQCRNVSRKEVYFSMVMVEMNSWVYLKDVTKESVYIYMEKIPENDCRSDTCKQVRRYSCSAQLPEGAAFPEQGEGILSHCAEVAVAALYNSKTRMVKRLFKIEIGRSQQARETGVGLSIMPR